MLLGNSGRRGSMKPVWNAFVALTFLLVRTPTKTYATPAIVLTSYYKTILYISVSIANRRKNSEESSSSSNLF